MENRPDVSSEEELLQLRNEGKISQEEYKELVETLQKTSILEKNKTPCSFRYGGFWRRLVALFIDCNIIAFGLFPILLLIAIAAPDYIVVDTPYNLFTSERVLESKKTTEDNADGSTTAIESKIVEQTVLDKWIYLYREDIRSNAGESETTRQLIDPKTRQDINKSTGDEFFLLAFLIYLTLMESSKLQASIGKIALGLKVVDEKGNQLKILRSFGRNMSKFLSLFTLFIGFMMAGWTSKKQALHDMVTNCYIIKRG